MHASGHSAEFGLGISDISLARNHLYSLRVSWWGQKFNFPIPNLCLYDDVLAVLAETDKKQAIFLKTTVDNVLLNDILKIATGKGVIILADVNCHHTFQLPRPVFIRNA